MVSTWSRSSCCVLVSLSAPLRWPLHLSAASLMMSSLGAPMYVRPAGPRRAAAEPPTYLHAPASGGSPYIEDEWYNASAVTDSPWRHPMWSFSENMVEDFLAQARLGGRRSIAPTVVARSQGPVSRQQVGHNQWQDHAELSGYPGRSARGTSGQANPGVAGRGAKQTLPNGGRPGFAAHSGSQGLDEPVCSPELRMLHDTASCKPCVFQYYGVCSQGAACQFCHLKHETWEYKAVRSRLSRLSRKKLAKNQPNATAAAAPAGPSANSATSGTSADSAWQWQ